MYTRLWLVLCAVLSVGLHTARGDTLFSQPVVNGGSAFPSDPAFTLFHPAGLQQADNFSLAAASTVTSLRWWGQYDTTAPASSNFQFRLFNDAAGVPATAHFDQQTLNNVTPVATPFFDSNGNPVFEFFATLPTAVTLAGSTTFYLSLFEQTPGSIWAWVADGPGVHYFRFADGTAWAPSGTLENHSFELYGRPAGVPPVPLPAAAWAGMALIGAIGATRARARAGKVRQRENEMSHA